MSEIEQFTGSTATAVRDRIVAALPPFARTLDIDLGETRDIDTAGLQALRSLHRELSSRGVSARVIGMSASVRAAFDSADLAALPPIVTS